MASAIKERITTRNSSIELLRIICILGVIILHYNNPDNGAAFSFVRKNTLQWFLCHFLESVFIIAVDVFMIISGYFLARNKQIKFWRPIELIVRVIVYSVGLYLLSVILGKSFSLKSLGRCLLPCNYFVILYCAVYIVSPYVNICLSRLSTKSLKILLVLLFCIFSLEPWLINLLENITGCLFNGLSFCGISGSQSGYDFVNFLLMYILGASLKFFSENGGEKKSTFVYLGINFICSLVILLLDYLDIPCVYDYEMPILVINALFIFKFFESLKINSKVINFLASGSFSVFLLHFIFMDKIKVEWACSQNIFVLLLHIFTSSILIYLICFCCHLIYELTVTKLLKRIQSKIKLELLIEEKKTTDE